MHSLDELIVPPVGMSKLDGIVVDTAVSTDNILKNIEINKNRKLPVIHQMSSWRDIIPIAIVGGGPSLKTQLNKLKDYKYILACGSVHDYLVENNIRANWCVVCDPDPDIMGTYLSRHNEETEYLIASQADPSLFELLKDRKVTMWHLFGDKVDPNIYGDGQIAVGGGCTVGTRAMVIALGMGFTQLHMFGFDNCLNGSEHHAYPFNDPEKEKIYDEYEIALEVDGPKFKVAGYHLGQLFDIKSLMKQYANKMHITVFGDSFFSYFIQLAEKRLKQYQEQENSNAN